jgi:hypothetical protein
MGSDPITQSISVSQMQALEKDRDATIQDYQMQVLSNYQALYDRVSTENKKIEVSYANELQASDTINQQRNYIKQSTGILSTIYTWAFWIYIGLGIILSGLYIIKKDVSNFNKIIIVAVIFAFPFAIYPLEKIIYTIVIYLQSLLLSNVYNNGFISQQMEYYNYTKNIIANTGIDYYNTAKNKILNVGTTAYDSTKNVLSDTAINSYNTVSNLVI